MKTSIIITLFFAATVEGMTVDELFRIWDANYGLANFGAFECEFVTAVSGGRPAFNGRWVQDGKKIYAESRSKEGEILGMVSYDGMKSRRYLGFANAGHINLGKTHLWFARYQRVTTMLGLTDGTMTGYPPMPLVPWYFNLPGAGEAPFSLSVSSDMVEVAKVSCHELVVNNGPHVSAKLYFAPAKAMALVKLLVVAVPSGKPLSSHEVLEFAKAGKVWYPKKFTKTAYNREGKVSGVVATTVVKFLPKITITDLDQFKVKFPSGCKVYDTELRLRWTEP